MVIYSRTQGYLAFIYLRTQGYLVFFRVRMGRGNASSQYPSIRRYDAEVTYAILLGEAKKIFNKKVSVPEIDTDQ